MFWQQFWQQSWLRMTFPLHHVTPESGWIWFIPLTIKTGKQQSPHFVKFWNSGLHFVSNWINDSVFRVEMHQGVVLTKFYNTFGLKVLHNSSGPTSLHENAIKIHCWISFSRTLEIISYLRKDKRSVKYWWHKPELHANVKVVQKVPPKCHTVLRCEHSMNPPWNS